MKHCIGFLFAGCTLAACGGGGGGGDDPALFPLNLGTTSTRNSANGLPFANPNIAQDGADLPALLGNETARLRIVRVGDAPDVGIDTPVGTLSSPGPGSFLLTIGDQQYRLFSTTDPNSASDGSNSFTQTFQQALDHVAVYRVVESVDTGILRSGFVLGHETRPQDLSGSVDYFLYITGSGTDTALTTPGQDVAIFGNGNLTTDFSTGTISGDAGLIVAYGAMTDNRDYIMSGQRIGNGFEGGLERGCNDGATCTSDNGFGGAFFGPGGIELGGIATISETVTLADTTTEFNAILVFTGGPPPTPRQLKKGGPTGPLSHYIAALRFSSTFSRKPSVVSHFWSGPTSSARSLVMKPLSTVSTTTFSSVVAKFISCVLSSSFARCFNPPVQAKIDAIELVEVALPA